MNFECIRKIKQIPKSNHPVSPNYGRASLNSENNSQIFSKIYKEGMIEFERSQARSSLWSWRAAVVPQSLVSVLYVRTELFFVVSLKSSKYDPFFFDCSGLNSTPF
jgi:hypothetical protein